MAGAPLPVPQYIDYEDNIRPQIGTDKILVSDTEPNAIPVAEADTLIAQGEMEVLWDLSPYYLTFPALITTQGGAWTTLQDTYPATYNLLYNMFVYKSSYDLLGNFLLRNTDDTKRTLSGFQNSYITQYNQYLNRVVEMLPNGGYKYLLAGLQTLNTGIPRGITQYAMGVDLGATSYVDEQVTNPRRNYDRWWGGRNPWLSN